jgi:hypothetical protein
LSCSLGKVLTQCIVAQTTDSSFLDLPTLPDNPRAVGAAPFCKGELLGTARPVESLHASRGTDVRSSRAEFYSKGVAPGHPVVRHKN